MSSCIPPCYESQENPGTAAAEQPVDADTQPVAAAEEGALSAAQSTDMTTRGGEIHEEGVNGSDTIYHHAVEENSSDDERSAVEDSDPSVIGSVDDGAAEELEEAVFEIGDKRSGDALEGSPEPSDAKRRRKDPPPLPHKSFFTGDTVLVSVEIGVEVDGEREFDSREDMQSFVPINLLEKFNKAHEADLMSRPLSTLNSAEMKERMLLEWRHFENDRNTMSSYEMADDCRKWIQRLDVMHRLDLAFSFYVFSLNEGVWNLRAAPVEERTEIQNEHNQVKAIFGSFLNLTYMFKGGQNLPLFNDIRECLTDYRY